MTQEVFTAEVIRMVANMIYEVSKVGIGGLFFVYFVAIIMKKKIKTRLIKRMFVLCFLGIVFGIVLLFLKLKLSYVLTILAWIVLTFVTHYLYKKSLTDN